MGGSLPIAKAAFLSKTDTEILTQQGVMAQTGPSSPGMSRAQCFESTHLARTICRLSRLRRSGTATRWHCGATKKAAAAQEGVKKG